MSSGLRQLPVLDANGAIEGVIDESDVTRAYVVLATSARLPDGARDPHDSTVG